MDRALRSVGTSPQNAGAEIARGTFESLRAKMLAPGARRFADLCTQVCTSLSELLTHLGTNNLHNKVLAGGAELFLTGMRRRRSARPASPTNQ